jgi:TRAP-type C4-dicarboxylate transport system permease small subunit
MDFLLRLDRMAIRWLRIVALLGFGAMMIGAAIVTTDALLRTFANRPIRGLSEIVDVSTAIVIATCFPIGLAQRRNIRIQLLSGIMGRLGNLVLDVVADVVLLVFVSIVAAELISYTAEAIRLGDRSLVLQIPAAPFWTATSAILTLSVPAQLLITAIDVARLVTGQPASEARSDHHA